MRVTRFCWILSMIFFLIDITGRWEKVDCNSDGVMEGVGEGGGDGDDGGDAILRNRHSHGHSFCVCVLFSWWRKQMTREVRNLFLVDGSEIRKGRVHVSSVEWLTLSHWFFFFSLDYDYELWFYTKSWSLGWFQSGCTMREVCGNYPLSHYFSCTFS